MVGMKWGFWRGRGRGLLAFAGFVCHQVGDGAEVAHLGVSVGHWMMNGADAIVKVAASADRGSSGVGRCLG